MIFLIIFGAIVGGLVDATMTFEDCKNLEFKPKACSVQEQLHKLGEKK